MSRKLIVLVILLVACGLAMGQTAAPKAEAPKANVPEAQKTEKVTDQAAEMLKQLHDELQKDRNAVVAAAMQLSEKDAAIFWPLYGEYRAAVKPVGERVSKLILDYSKTWEKITDEQAAGLLKEWLAIQKLETETKAAWVPKFTAKLPAKVVARFFQVENKLDTIVRLELAAEVPLVE